MNRQIIISIAFIVAGLTLGMYGFSNMVTATGGAGQIAELVMTHLESAQTYLNEGDTKSASQEIEIAIKELMDTYEADKE